jgi:hypothetical protein
MLKIEIGREYLWVPAYRYEHPEIVRVVSERKRSFKLSNGWVVDDFGVAEGTDRMRGGKITELPVEGNDGHH